MNCVKCGKPIEDLKYTKAKKVCWECKKRRVKEYYNKYYKK
jgi:hypothetical protein